MIMVLRRLLEAGEGVEVVQNMVDLEVVLDLARALVLAW
jgi:hypothetical protein